MGKQGHGIGKGKPKLKDRGFGQALIRQQQTGGSGNKTHINYYADVEVQKTLFSNLESSDLAEYMEGLELENKGVDVRRVKSDADAAFLVEGTTLPKTIQSITTSQFDYEHIEVPRKPEWNNKMNREEVDFNERNAFLAWRRKLAAMEEANNGKYRITPFEKNLEVWRQLWRVLEKSDIGVQVVDARNPMLYYTEDLLKYGMECGCPTILLLNKADFLTEYQRKAWAQYFDNKGVQYAFYSAVNEQKCIDTVARLSQRPALDPEEAEELEKARNAMDKCDAEEARVIAEDIVRRIVSASQAKTKTAASGNGESVGTDASAILSAEERLEQLEKAELLQRRCRVLSRAELVLTLQLIPKFLQKTPSERHQGRMCVGLIGFPNVGKSSCINSMLAVSKMSHGTTRVAVSSTPGKTKHFQTLIVNDTLMLCDCPGLVFPSFMRSTAEMLCAGILPINQMREYQHPANVITSRVPMHLLEAAYGIKIMRDIDIKDNPERPPTGSEMLCAYCKTKGYITNSTGRWDEFRACKEIIRDFCDGYILFVAPPDVERAQSGVASSIKIDYRRWLQETEYVMQRNERVADRLALRRLQEYEAESKKSKAEAKGRAGIENTEMVFGDGSWKSILTATEPDLIVPTVFQTAENLANQGSSAHSSTASTQRVAIQYDDESDEDESAAIPDTAAAGSAATTAPKRDHKRLKHWGKKNKKLRDKNPYGEESGKVSYALTTSRAKPTGYTPNSR